MDIFIGNQEFSHAVPLNRYRRNGISMELEQAWRVPGSKQVEWRVIPDATIARDE